MQAAEIRTYNGRGGVWKRSREREKRFRREKERSIQAGSGGRKKSLHPAGGKDNEALWEGKNEDFSEVASSRGSPLERVGGRSIRWQEIMRCLN